MALGSGARLGVYEIIAPVGAGGMGEVYRARDTNLGRDVALKILPAGVAADPERVARFRREAQLLASLNHPHIAAIYGFEESGGAQFLVLELVDGETLADRLKRGPLAAADAVGIALQIAEALADAHEKGIVHRDLKPSNVALTSNDRVKVLDFGLAKLVTPAATVAASSTSLSPTLTTPALNTGVGTLLGTAAYMAPEQAKGREVDRRCDIWAFGCVLFEMLTAKQAFAGEDVLDTLTAIMRGEPDWQALPPEVPDHIRALVKRCLVKERRQRLADISIAIYIISEGAAAAAAPRPASASSAVVSLGQRARIAAAGAIGGMLLAAGGAWILSRPAPQVAQQTIRFTIAPPPDQAVVTLGAERDVAISPDGSTIAYRAGAQGQLAVRRLDQLEAQLLPGTATVRDPFFSPDSHWIGFFDGNELKKVSTTGGPPVTVCLIGAPNPRGASWGDDNTIVFATGDRTTGLLSVPAGGGDPKVLTAPDVAARELDHVFPTMLPGGRAVVFTIQIGQLANTQLALLDLKTGHTRTLIRGGSSAEYVQSGHLVYAAAGTLRAVRFDLARLEVLGDPVPVLERVMTSNFGAANYAISRTGTLVYIAGALAGSMRHLVWVDRNGREEPINAGPRAYVMARISPDGSRVALDIRDQENDIWVWDGQRLTRLTFDPGVDQQPVWTPDGRRIIFSSARSGAANLFWRAADGTGADERITTAVNAQFPNAVTPDGAYVLGFEVFPKTIPDVVRIPLSNPGTPLRPGTPSIQRESEVLVQSNFAEYNADISPDGRFLAYQSNESGQFEIYVRPYPKVNDGKWQVSTGGGTRPAWSRNGRELFFVDASNALVSVAVQTAAVTFTAGNPEKVLDAAKYALPVASRAYDVSPDGRRLLMITDASSGDKAVPPELVVVERWSEELRQRVPAR